MPSRSRRKTPLQTPKRPNNGSIIVTSGKNHCCFEGDGLSRFLHSFHREIELERQSNKILPEKLWFKQHFAVGINQVTRLLERMSPSSDATVATAREEESFSLVSQGQDRPPYALNAKLQAVLVASDCNSRWLTKHLPSLASSRNIPLIYVKDHKEGSLRLGELVKVRTALAIGVKTEGNGINRFVEQVLHRDEINGTGCADFVDLATE